MSEPSLDFLIHGEYMKYSDEEWRFMYRIDQSHLAVFCNITFWPRSACSPVRIIAQVQRNWLLWLRLNEYFIIFFILFHLWTPKFHWFREIKAPLNPPLTTALYVYNIKWRSYVSLRSASFLLKTKRAFLFTFSQDWSQMFLWKYCLLIALLSDFLPNLVVFDT